MCSVQFCSCASVQSSVWSTVLGDSTRNNSTLAYDGFLKVTLHGSETSNSIASSLRRFVASARFRNCFWHLNSWSLRIQAPLMQSGFKKCDLTNQSNEWMQFAIEKRIKAFTCIYCIPCLPCILHFELKKIRLQTKFGKFPCSCAREASASVWRVVQSAQNEAWWMQLSERPLEADLIL